MNRHTANIKYIEHKYRNEDKVDIEDVRAMAKHYKDKIKRLKFLLNDTKRDFDECQTKLWHNAICSQSYVNRFVHVYSEQLEALDKDALKDLEKYIEEHKAYW